MTIRIKDEGKGLFFWFPNFIIFNGLVYKIAKKLPGGERIPDIPPKLLRDLRITSRKMNRIHKKWYLVELSSKDRSMLKIKL